jgi:hypothetical protein
VERAIAEQLMHQIMAMNEPLNAAALLTERITDKAEHDSLKRVIGSLMQAIYIDLMRPVIRQYPDLDPDKS